MLHIFFSCRSRHTRWPRYWSSDVCSSDLGHPESGHRGAQPQRPVQHTFRGRARGPAQLVTLATFKGQCNEIGRASWREREEMPVAHEGCERTTRELVNIEE